MRHAPTTVLVLALILALAGFACEAGETRQVPARGEKGDAQKAVATPETTALLASTSDSATSNAEYYKFNCRIQTYIIKENFSEAEVKDFTVRMTYRVTANLDGGGVKDMDGILDGMDVPAYEGICH